MDWAIPRLMSMTDFFSARPKYNPAKPMAAALPTTFASTHPVPCGSKPSPLVSEEKKLSRQIWSESSGKSRLYVSMDTQAEIPSDMTVMSRPEITNAAKIVVCR